MKNRYKHFLFFILYLISVTGYAQTQLSGTVCDNVKEPICSVNVVLSESETNKFITGVVTLEDGTFSLKIPQNTDIKKALLTFSFIGYKKQTIHLSEIKKFEQIKVVLEVNDILLNEAVVKGHKEMFKTQGSTIIADIDKTILSKVGRLDNLMNWLPFVSGENGVYNIFGRGTALVYLNGRKVYDPMVLKNLTSHDIKKIEILTNPGAQYSATTRAVIRITTKPKQGEGIGGTAYVYAQQSKKMSNVANVSLAYNRNKWEVTGGFSYNRTNMKIGIDEEVEITSNDQKTKNSTDIDYLSNFFSGSLGVNYQKNANTNYGIYTNMDGGNMLNDVKSSLQHFNREVMDFNSPTRGDSKNKPFKWRTNLYYSSKVGKTTFTFSDDILTGHKKDYFTYFEERENASVTTDGSMNYFMNTFIGDATMPLLGPNGNLSYGFEVTNSANNQSFNYNESNIESNLKNTTSKQNQLLLAAYLSYSKTWGILSADAGLRYEYIKSEYYQNGEKNKDASEHYGDIFPTLNVSINPKKNVYLSLGYKYIIKRPGYGSLNDNIQYNNRYYYVQGNSTLKPSKQHIITALMSFWKFRVISSYNCNLNSFRGVKRQYENGSETVLSRIENLPDYNDLSFGLSWSDRFAFYSSSINLGYSQQFFSFAYLNENRKYNKPSFSISMNHAFSLPGKYSLTANFSYRSKQQKHFVESNEKWGLSIGASKTFNNGLYMAVKASNLLRTRFSTSDVTSYDIKERSSSDYDTRNISLMISYTFNYRKKKFTNNLKSSEINRF